MKSVTDEMERIDLGMTNFDHSIDVGLDEALRASPGKVCAAHPGWNFHGKVWFDDGKFHEEVWVYGSVCEVIDADSLPELMSAVCDKYGAA